MSNIFDLIGLNAASVFAGLVGGIISLTYEKNITFRRAAILIFTGGAMAGYITPLATHYAELTPAFTNPLSFLIGLVSMKLVGFFMSKIEQLTAKPIDIKKIIDTKN